MKIGVLVLMAGRNAGGPETYEVQLIRALSRIDHTNEYIVYCTGPEAERAIAVRQDNFRFTVLKPAVRPVSLSVTLPAVMVRDGIDFLHSTFTPPPFCPSKLLFTVHCLSSIVHPEAYKPAVARRLNYLLKTGIRKAQLLTCVSEFTRNHVAEMFGVAPERMFVSYNGVGEQFHANDADASRELLRGKFGIERPYILYVGKLQRHKNVIRLLGAYDRFRSSCSSDAVLLLAGRMAGDSAGIAEKIASMRWRNDVILPGYVPFEFIPHLYRAARAFVYPSLWEGFGIPIVEAMASGVPVVTSKVTCLPEIAGGAAITVDPHDEAELADALTVVDTREDVRADLKRRGLERARAFSWENCARATMNAYVQMNRC